MSEFKLMNAWARVRRHLDRQTADAVLSKHGGSPGQPNSVPPSNVAACIAALNALMPHRDDDDGDDYNGFESAKAKPKTLDAVAIYKRWNSPRQIK